MGTLYRMRSFTSLIVFLGCLSSICCHLGQSQYNKGWEKYFADEPSMFHNVPLSWEHNASLPSWLRGSYIKNGPSQKQFGTEERWYSQWMDSWGKLNKITFTESGEVLYSGRMIETRNYNRCVEADRIVPSVTVAGLAPNDWSLTEMMAGVLHLFDNTNVLLWRLGSEDPQNATYIATTDYPLVNIIDPDSLAVTGKYQPNPLTEGISMQSSSHWRREVGTDNSLNYHMMYNPLTLKPDFILYRYGRTMEDKTEIGRFPVDYVSYIHMISNTPQYAGYRNRYTYGWVGIDYWRQTLVKKDLEDTTNYKMWSTESHYPGELFFIPNPAGIDEDDGVLITIVFDGEREQSYVLLLDGRTFTEIDRSYLPYNVPFSFHGNWFP